VNQCFEEQCPCSVVRTIWFPELVCGSNSLPSISNYIPPICYLLPVNAPACPFWTVFSFPETVSKNGITEGFGLEGTLKLIWFQPPCHGQGPLLPAQGAQSSIQPGLEPCQGGGSHSFSGQPGPGPHCPQSEEFLPYIQSKPPLFQLEAITPCPVAPCPCHKALSIPLTGPSGHWHLL